MTAPRIPPPRRIEWAGPNGWTVWADEDGCHVRPANGAIEESEVRALLELWSAVRAAFHDGTPAPFPTPPDLPF